MTTDLRDALHERLDHLPVPTGDLDRVRASGTRLRRRRRVAAAAAVVGVVALATVLGLGGSDDPTEGRGIDPIGQLDFSQGLRAYADPGATVHLGGRELPYGALQGLDTDAVATPAGIVYYDGVPLLLEETGRSTPLQPDAETGSFSPTAKADPATGEVAYGAVLDGEPTVVVRDVGSGEEVARRTVTEDVAIDGIDGGVVLLRTDDGTTAWDVASGEVQELAGPRTRVADVRNDVLLYDGPAPDGPAAAAYRLVEGAIDAQLTHDGSHVLHWSDRLEPTGGDPPVVLDLPVEGVGFYTFDTDGSVLVAVMGRRDADVFDCDEVSGQCDRIGTIATLHGDPEFIGNDM